MVIDAFYVCDVQFFSAYNFISNKQTLPDNPCYNIQKSMKHIVIIFRKKKERLF